MKAKRGDINKITEDIMRRKLVGLQRAGALVQSQAIALVKTGKYPSGSGKVGGALKNSIYLIIEGDSAKIGSSLEYAAIQEFGGTITPYRAKALTIPLAPEAYGKRASDFDGLFVLKTNGKAFLCGVVNDELIFYYILLKSVTIPKQPYLRPALAATKKRVIKIIQDA